MLICHVYTEIGSTFKTAILLYWDFFVSTIILYYAVLPTQYIYTFTLTFIVQFSIHVYIHHIYCIAGNFRG